MRGDGSRALRATLAVVLVAGVAVGENAAGSAEQTQLMAARFAARFAEVGPQVGEHLDAPYAADVVFRDPVTSLTGNTDLSRYRGHFGETPVLYSLPVEAMLPLIARGAGFPAQ